MIIFYYWFSCVKVFFWNRLLNHCSLFYSSETRTTTTQERKLSSVEIAGLTISVLVGCTIAGVAVYFVRYEDIALKPVYSLAWMGHKPILACLFKLFQSDVILLLVLKAAKTEPCVKLCERLQLPLPPKSRGKSSRLSKLPFSRGLRAKKKYLGTPSATGLKPPAHRWTECWINSLGWGSEMERIVKAQCPVHFRARFCPNLNRPYLRDWREGNLFNPEAIV